MRTQRTSELDCRLGRLIVVVVVALLAASVARVETQGAGDLLTIGIFPFQDESGSGVPTLAPGVAQMVRQRLLSVHGDTLAGPCVTARRGL